MDTVLSRKIMAFFQSHKPSSVMPMTLSLALVIGAISHAKTVFGVPTIKASHGIIVQENQPVPSLSDSDILHDPIVRDFFIQVNVPYNEVLESVKLVLNSSNIDENSRELVLPPVSGQALDDSTQYTFRFDNNPRNFLLWQVGLNQLQVVAETSNDSSSTQILLPFEPLPSLGLGREGDGRLGSSFKVPGVPIFVSDCASIICKDADEDGLLDLWEDLALRQLNSVLEHDEGETLFKVEEHIVRLFTRIVPVVENDEYYIVFLNSVTYTKDYGAQDDKGNIYDAHNGDTERTRTAWRVNGNEIRLELLETGVHICRSHVAGFFLDLLSGGNDFGIFNCPFSQIPGHGSGKFQLYEIELTPEGFIKVYVERDKHGIWNSRRTCADGPYRCGWDMSGTKGVFRPIAYNVGEPPGKLPGGRGRALIDSLTDLDEFTNFPGEAVWSDPDEKFCGGLKCTGNSPKPLSRKLGNNAIPLGEVLPSSNSQVIFNPSVVQD